MKKLNITKKQFSESRYFTTKYGKLEYVSESGKFYKTSKGKILKFNESQNDVTIDDFKRMYGNNAAEALIKYCDVKNKDAESVINGSDSDMARFENWAKKVLHVDIYDKFSGYDYDSDLDDSRSEIDESSNDIEIELENLLDIVHDNGMTYDEMESTLKKLGFEMNEYGGERNAYAIFKHPCGIDVTVEYEFEKVVGSKDSWKAGMVTDISWELVDTPLMESSNDDTEKEFTYKGITITRYDYESLPYPMAASQVDDKTMMDIAKEIYNLFIDNGWSDIDIQKYGADIDEIADDNPEMDMFHDEWWTYMEKAAIKYGMPYYEDMDDI